MDTFYKHIVKPERIQETFWQLISEIIERKAGTSIAGVELLNVLERVILNQFILIGGFNALK